MILDYFSRHLEVFRPTDIRQYTVFQIARDFGDQARLRLYLLAAEDHTPFELAQAYRRTKRSGEPAEEFFRLLKKIKQTQ